MNKNQKAGQKRSKKISTKKNLSDAERNSLLNEMAAMLESPVDSVDKIPVTSGHYEIQTKDQAIRLGPVQNILTQEKFGKLFRMPQELQYRSTRIKNGPLLFLQCWKWLN